jgi:hypothetical protein
MKKFLLSTLSVGVMLCAATANAALDFASLPGSDIQFGPGSQFTVTSSLLPDAALAGGSAQWWITSSGPASGLFGAFSGGPWTYGAITINGDGSQTANVLTTGGAFAIDDGAGKLLTGNVNWVQVYTLGATGGLNAGAMINITGLSYTGSNAALLALLATSDGTMQLAFQFATTESLTDLSDGATIGTSYNGTLAAAAATAVPEPATIIAGLLLLLPLGMSTLRILRKNAAVY